jgi:hypothetical protein
MNERIYLTDATILTDAAVLIAVHTIQALGVHILALFYQ